MFSVLNSAQPVKLKGSKYAWAQWIFPVTMSG